MMSIFTTSHTERSAAGRAGRRRMRSLWLVPLFFAICQAGTAFAASTLDDWRNEAGRIRALAENDLPRAYEAARHLQATLPADATPVDQARLLNLLSRIELYRAQTDEAAAHAQQARELAEKNGDRVGQAEAALNVAMNAINQSRIDDVIGATNRAMVALDGVDRPDLLGEAMLRTAMLYRRKGQFDEAVTMAMQQMEMAKRSHSPLVMVYAYQGLAIAYEQSGRDKDARDYFTRMLEQARAVPSKLLEASALLALGNIVAHEGDIAKGEEMIREGVSIHRSVGGPFFIGHGLFTLADLLRHHGHPADALPLFDEATTIWDSHANKIGLWWTLNARSETQQALGHFTAAQSDAERGYKLAKEIGLVLYMGESAKRVAAIAAVHGDYQKAYILSMEKAEMEGRAEREKANTRMVELAQRYQAESKQREIDELNHRNQLQTAELEQRALQQRWLWTLVGGGGVILIGTLLFLLRLRHSNQLLEELNAQVRRSQRKLQATLDAIPDLMFEMGLDGRYHDCHSPQSDLLVASVDVLLGKTVLEVLPPEAAAVCMAALQEAHEKGLSVGKQYELSLPQGRFWFELSVARKQTEAGQEPRFIGIARDITERKRMQDALSEREQRYREIFDNVLDSLYLLEVTTDGRIRNLDINPAFEKSTGLPREALIGKFVEEVVPAQTARIVLDKYRRCIDEGAVIEEESTLDLPSGLRHYQTSLLPVRDDSGRVHRIVGISRDITERKRAEELLHAREQEFRAMVENSPDIIARYDTQCRRIYVNPAMQAQFSLPVDEILGKTPTERCALDEVQPYMQRIRRVLETGQEENMEFSFHDPQAVEHWGDMRLVPEFGTDGSVISVLAITRDITQRIKAERQLHASEQMFRAIVENTPDLIVRLDRECRRIYINPAMDRMGMGSNRLLGKTPLESVMGESAPALASATVAQETVMRVLQTGLPAEAELSWTLPDGKLIHLDIQYAPELDPQGKVASVVSIARDISVRKQMEHDLEASELLLRRLAARNESAREDERKHLKRELHDELGQYLLALRLGVSVVDLQFGGGNAALHEKTQRLITMVDATIKVVRDVVTSLRPSALDLGIVSALEWLAQEYEDFGGRELHCELHVCEEDIQLDEARATAIFRIVQESLTNVVRHAQATKVDITLVKNEVNYLLEVRDNGMGFEPTIRKEKSFGLVGIRERALALGGEVDIASAPGQSTSIRVHIPIHSVLTNALSES